MIVMAGIIEAQSKLVEYAVSGAYQEINQATKQKLQRTVSGVYQDAFVKNGDMLGLIVNTSGLQQAMLAKNRSAIRNILQNTFTSNFLINGFSEVGVFDNNGAYLASDEVSDQTLKNDFKVELASVAKTKQPYYSVKCSSKSCLGYSTIPVMLSGADIGYIVAGFDLKELFSQYLSAENIAVSLQNITNNQPVQDADSFQFKLPLIYLPDSVFVTVTTKSVSVKAVTQKLQRTLSVADMFGGLVVVFLIFYLISVRSGELIKIAEMIVSLGSGNFKRFKEISKEAPKKLLFSVKEFSKIRQSAFDLAGRLDNAVNETIMRVVAEKVAVEKKTALSKVSREFEFQRKQLAQEFHDDLGQRMVALRFMSKMLPKCATLADVAVMAESISAVVAKMDESVTSILGGLHPPLIDALGIVGAITAVVAEMEALKGQRACEFNVIITDKLAGADVAIQVAIFRIVQEALTNAIKYARPKHINITIRSDSDDWEEYISGEIENDGEGFDVANAGLGLGLIGMRERVMHLNGEFTVSSKLSEGTRIEFSIPLA